jgi:hypothetical protein
MMMGLQRRPWLLLLGLVTVAVAFAAASEGDADPLYQYAPLCSRYPVAIPSSRPSASWSRVVVTTTYDLRLPVAHERLVIGRSTVPSCDWP